MVRRGMARVPRRFAPALAVLVLTAACSGGSGGAGGQPTASRTPVPTWDLVYFSDSSAPPSALWAKRIEERLGVHVVIHDFWGGGDGGAARTVLERLSTENEVRQAVAGAEIIGVELNPALTVTGDALGAVCVPGDSTPRDPPAVYSTKDFVEYADLIRKVYDLIFELRAGQPTVVRAMDLYVPVRDAWTAAGIEPECSAGWEAITATIHGVAAEYGIPTASFYDAFNGPNHDQDPVDKGFIGPDGAHPNDKGNAVQIDVLDALGYEPVQRPT